MTKEIAPCLCKHRDGNFFQATLTQLEYAGDTVIPTEDLGTLYVFADLLSHNGDKTYMRLPPWNRQMLVLKNWVGSVPNFVVEEESCMN